MTNFAMNIQCVVSWHLKLLFCSILNSIMFALHARKIFSSLCNNEYIFVIKEAYNVVLSLGIFKLLLIWTKLMVNFNGNEKYCNVRT